MSICLLNSHEVKAAPLSSWWFLIMTPWDNAIHSMILIDLSISIVLKETWFPHESVHLLSHFVGCLDVPCTVMSIIKSACKWFGWLSRILSQIWVKLESILSWVLSPSWVMSSHVYISKGTRKLESSTREDSSSLMVPTCALRVLDAYAWLEAYVPGVYVPDLGKDLLLYKC